MKRKPSLLRDDLATLVKRFASTDVVETMARQYANNVPKQLPLALIIDNERLKHLKIPHLELQKAALAIDTNRDVAPIIVRPIADKFEIVLGRRRYHAALEAQLPFVSAIIQPFAEDEMMLTIIANLRQSRDSNALSIATLCKALQQEFGYTQQALSLVAHVSRPTIANLMRLLKLPTEVQRQLMKGDISYGHARALINLEPAAINKIVPRLLAEQWSVRQLETIIRLMDGHEFEEAISIVCNKEFANLTVEKKRVIVSFSSEKACLKFVKRLHKQKIL